MQEHRTAHQRTHSLLLLQRLFSLRSGVSPFTLLLDTTEQSSRPVIHEFIAQAKTAKTSVIYISFETLRQPKDVTHFIRAHKLSLTELQKEISSKISSTSNALLIIDALHPLLSHQTSSLSLSTFLTSLLPSPQVSLLATYHTSIPLPPSLSNAQSYTPLPIQVLTYLATTIIHVESFHHVLAEKRAKERAVAPPVFGLETGLEGVVLGRGANGAGSVGEGGGAVALRIEHRRKSGRGVGLDAVLMFSDAATAAAGSGLQAAGKRMMLLDEHPLYAPKREVLSEDRTEDMSSTFSLDLTDKQRRDRDGVVLPYFDAQKGEGPGDGGRILYQMGEEDLGDWDEEEDEI